jgi:hypothetical protein
MDVRQHFTPRRPTGKPVFNIRIYYWLLEDLLNAGRISVAVDVERRGNSELIGHTKIPPKREEFMRKQAFSL